MVRALALLVCCSGCASTLSTLQTAETTPRGHAELHAGLGGYAPLGALPHLARAAELEGKGLSALATTGAHPAATEQRDELLDAALSLALETPGPVWELGARYGLLDFWDVGARLSSNDWSVDTKLRFFQRPLGKDVTHSAAIDFRYDLELDGLYTIDVARAVRLYGGPKLVRTQFHADANAFQFGNDASAYAGLPPLAADLDDTMWFYGGVAGISGSYRRVSVFLELDAGWTQLTPTLLGERRNLGGVTLYPAVGIALGL